ncbi:conjugal transfer protein TraC [Gilliamella sp. BG6]|uniref:conjugal transfer protein TraC n=1 Tax=unclassified Gilliamella TaxID=2685620 RepID=UPI00398849D9
MFYKHSKFFLIILLTMFIPETFAAGGLDAGIQATSDLKMTAYKWLAVLASGYIVFTIIQVYFGIKSWGSVAMSVVYCAVAGGVIWLGSYAWSIFN